MTEKHVHRCLAAIAIADVAGFSRLMGIDEAGTLAALSERRKRILEPVGRAHEGRIVKVMGDGVPDFRIATPCSGGFRPQRKSPCCRSWPIRCELERGDPPGRRCRGFAHSCNLSPTYLPLWVEENYGVEIAASRF